MVFSATVLPPVFGPLMMSCRSSAVSSSSSGTIWPPVARSRFSSSGWRAAFEAQQLRSKARRNAVEVARKARPRQQAVDQRQHARAFNQTVRVAAHLPRERDKDAMNLRLLLFDEPHQLVVLLDGFERLHIDRLPRRARAVNHAGDAPLELRAHGNHEALAANGDDVVLRRILRGQLAQRRAQAFFDQLSAGAPARGECDSAPARHRRPATHRAESCARSTRRAAASSS